MKLGYFRHNANLVRKDRKLTFIDFLIVLYVSEQDYATKYDIRKYVTNSNGTVTESLTYLIKQGMLKVAREFKTARGFSRQYSVGMKGRNMIQDFYTLMERSDY
jgi:DNA-binding MarR family transcriptional regulator